MSPRPDPRASHPAARSGIVGPTLSRPLPRALSLVVALSLAPAGARAQAPVESERLPLVVRDPAIPPDEARGPQDPLATSEPQELALPPIREVLRARTAEDAGRPAEAAQVLEALWAQSGDPRYLYHAALARARAGQHALALRHLLLWQERGAAAGDAARRRVEAQIAAERALTTPIRVQLALAPGRPAPPAEVATAKISLTLEGTLGQGPPATISWQGTATQEVRVDRGAWQILVECPGFLPSRARFVAAGEAELAWEVIVARRQVAVDLRFSPPRALRKARLSLRSDESGAVIERELLSPTLTLMLASGPWLLNVEAPKYRAAQALVVAADRGPIEVVLTKRPREDHPGRRLERTPKFAYVAAGLLGAGYIAGVGLLLGAANRSTRIEDRTEKLLMDPTVDLEAVYPTAEYHRDLRRITDLGTSGAFIAMFGIGSVVGVVPMLLKARRRSSAIELAVGAAGLGGGAALLASYYQRRDAVLGRTDPEHRLSVDSDDPFSGQRIGGAMLAGMGAGMFLFSAALLIHDTARHKRGLSAAPLVAPGLAGLSLRGRF